jgi:hypothetical protein
MLSKIVAFTSSVAALLLALALTEGSTHPAWAGDLLTESFDDKNPAGWALTTNGTGGPPTTEDELGPAGCSDGMDNDLDGATDCGDLDCLGVPPCVAAAPAAPWPIAALLLLIVGWFGVSNRRARH